tara:strand:+ start:880 stop:1128 length:249 start_codon:yes stop_codon:yes gene_type:complete
MIDYFLGTNTPCLFSTIVSAWVFDKEATSPTLYAKPYNPVGDTRNFTFTFFTGAILFFLWFLKKGPAPLKTDPQSLLTQITY